MDKERTLKLYHDQIVDLINSYEGRTLIGKLTRSRQDIREAYLKKAKDRLLMMIDLDESSPYVEDARQKFIKYL